MQALDPEQDGWTAAIIQENFDEEIYQDRVHARVYRRARKAQGHWDAFVQYKSSELGLQKVQKAKDNASKKVYHHTLGQGGYKLAVPKWEKMEQDLLDRGIQPATMNWPERSSTWFYGHGGSLDPLTGNCIYGPNI